MGACTLIHVCVCFRMCVHVQQYVCVFMYTQMCTYVFEQCACVFVNVCAYSKCVRLTVWLCVHLCLVCVNACVSKFGLLCVIACACCVCFCMCMFEQIYVHKYVGVSTYMCVLTHVSMCSYVKAFECVCLCV